MRTKRKGNKVDCIAAEKRANTVELMKKMPQMLLDYKICVQLLSYKLSCGDKRFVLRFFGLSRPGSLVLAGSAKSEAKVVLFDPGTVVEMDEEGCWLEDPEPSQLLCLTVPLPCLPEWPNF
uniref:Uncharacterized protein n=1 Tax=Aegilops tauschii TaxID=37682 RepID=M8BE95_AEGTA